MGKKYNFSVLIIQNVFKIAFLQQPKPVTKNSELQSLKLYKMATF